MPFEHYVDCRENLNLRVSLAYNNQPRGRLPFLFLISMYCFGRPVVQAAVPCTEAVGYPASAGEFARMSKP